MQNAHYVEDRLGTPSGAQKMAVSAPFWRPNGFENGFLKASETATAPQDLKDTQKASKKARKKTFHDKRTGSAVMELFFLVFVSLITYIFFHLHDAPASMSLHSLFSSLSSRHRHHDHSHHLHFHCHHHCHAPFSSLSQSLLLSCFSLSSLSLSLKCYG